MSAEVLDGRPVASALRERARVELQRFRNAYAVEPKLAIMLVGEDPSARAYQSAIVRAAGSIELTIETMALPAMIDQAEIDRVIDNLNRRDDVHGVLVLQPLPPHLSRFEIADRLDPFKDVDGITTFNAGRLFLDDRNVLAPSTPAGGMALLKHYQVPIAGRLAVVVGRSPVVGRPMGAMLLAADATVTICHSRTRDLPAVTREADILVSAVGKPHIIQPTMVKPGATVVDFGVNFVGGRMIGDVDRSVVEIAGQMTPVPGGTGRVTTTILLRNTVKAATLQCQREAIRGDTSTRKVAADGE